MLSIRKSFKILLSLFLSLSFSFPLKSEASLIKRSHIYKEALQTLMTGHASVEKVLRVISQDKNEIVTTKLQELNIELDKVSFEKASDELQDTIFKILAEEYIKARKVELEEFSLYIKNNLTSNNPSALEAELKSQMLELQRDVDYFRENIGMDSNTPGVRVTVASIFGILAYYSFHLMSLALPLTPTFPGTLFVITTGAIGLFSSYIATLQVYDFTKSQNISESSKSSIKQLAELKMKSKQLLNDLKEYKNTHSEIVLP